jgi:rhodanese-related sulfurtransferase
MKFIYFFIAVLMVFLLILYMISLIIKYLNDKPTIQSDIEGGQLTSLDNRGVIERLADLKKNINEYFDTNLIKYKEANENLRIHYYDFVIDVRTQNEWNDGHYPTATHVPLEPENEFIKKIDYYNRNLKYLVYCRSGRRAKIAVKIMKNMGFTNVKYLLGTYKRLNMP